MAATARVCAVATDEDAPVRLRAEAFDVIISDVVMPGLHGLDVLEQARVLAPEGPVILLTAYATVETAVEALRRGAADSLLKPFRSDDRLARVQRLQHGAAAKQPLPAHPLAGAPLLHPTLVGRSPAMACCSLPSSRGKGA